TGAGAGTHISDDEYREAGAEIVSVDEVWSRSELIVKVKEPRPLEYPRIRPGQLVFTYFHFAADEELMGAMVSSGAFCIAYETVQLSNGHLPLLTPMSEVAGRLSIQEGAKYLERPMGGRGVLLSGVPGVQPAVVAVIGAGVVGLNAIKVAAGFGATVYCLDINLDRLRYLDDIFPNNVITLHSNPGTLRKVLQEVDLLIGAVYVTGTRAPVLVDREMLKLMKPGSVIVDVCVDQGGCFATTHPTTHRNPTYVVEGVVHYGVANMPGAVAHTSTYALTNATLPYVLKLADEGLDALREDPALRSGLNVAAGKVTLEAIANQYGYDFVPTERYLEGARASKA
ncbi:MAG TPA: alanine dehydrogenase, partial [Fimbriimonas sp.]